MRGSALKPALIQNQPRAAPDAGGVNRLKPGSFTVALRAMRRENQSHLSRLRPWRYGRFMDGEARRTFFITTNTAGRRRLFQVASNAELLLRLFDEDRAKGRYQIHAYVIMPDHLHMILTPAADVSVERALQFIKGGYSFRLRSKTKLWQESFAWERVKDVRDFEVHRQYIHANPVRQHLCAGADDYEYSSARGLGVDPVPQYLRA